MPAGKILALAVAVVLGATAPVCAQQPSLEQAQPTRTEAGCLNYDLHQSHDDPALFLFYENWASQAHLDAHAQSAHIQAFRAQGAELLAEPVEIKFFHMVSQPQPA